MGLASITNNIITDTGVSPSGLISGSGASGQVTYWTGAATISGNNNLFWSGTALGVGTNTPSTTLHVSGSTYLNGAIELTPTVASGDITIGNNAYLRMGSTRFRATGVAFQFQDNAYSDRIVLNTAGGFSSFNNGAGNYGFGTGTDDGVNKLQVAGNTKISGNLTLINTGTTTFTYSGAGSFSHDAVGTGGQLVYTPSSGIRYKFAGGTSGFIFGATSNTQTTGTTILISNNTSPNNNVFQSSVTPNFTGGGDLATIALSGTVALDSLNNLSGGIQTGIKVAETFSPNTANKDIRYIGASIQPTINQTAGLTQITRGVHINPTLTAAVDFRAIEWSNNVATAPSVSWGLYGAGTAPNYINGSLLIGSATNDTVNKLQVTGTAVAGSHTSTVGSVILRGYYTSGYLTTFGTDASSGGPMLSYAVESAKNSTEGAFVSSTPNVDTPRSAYTVSANHRWYTAPTSTTAVGTAISLTKHMELFNSGNLVLGGAAEVAGSKLQVNGNAFIKGSGSDATTSGLLVQNSGGTNILNVQNGGNTFFGANIFVASTVYSSSGNLNLEPGSSASLVRLRAFANTNSYANVNTGAGAFTITAGDIKSFVLDQGFAPTSGTATMTYVLVNPTINQTGSTGITRGLHVNPTLTAAPNWRSIEWSNDTGWGIYGTGVAPNQMNGRLTVSATIPQTGTNGFSTFANNRIGLFGAQSIDVPTTAAFNQGTVTAAGTSAQYLTFNGNTTVGGDALLAGSVHINSVQFATTGTITMNNSAAGGQRTLSVMQLQMQKAGIVGGTINRGSTLYLFGVYPTTSTGGTVTFTEYAGLRIGNLMEWVGGTPPNTTVALTNKWGIYQEGPADPNYFAGAVGVGVTTPHPTAKLQVDSLTQGFLPPRMSEAERDAIVNPAEGLIVYVTDATINKHFGYNGISWNAFY